MLGYKLSGILIALVVMSSAAHAYGVYKTVDADGNVVYTDKPPENKNYDAIKTPAAAPPPANIAPATTPADVPATRSHGAKSATRTNKKGADTTANTGPDPVLEGAIIGVLGIEDLVKQIETICGQARPTNAKKYWNATDSWKQRNDATVALANHVMAQVFDAAGRQRLKTVILKHNEQQLAVANAAPLPSKFNWCDRSSAEITKGDMDVHNNPKLTTPLKNYRSP